MSFLSLTTLESGEVIEKKRAISTSDEGERGNTNRASPDRQRRKGISKREGAAGPKTGRSEAATQGV